MHHLITNLAKDESQRLAHLTAHYYLDPMTATAAQRVYRQLRRDLRDVQTPLEEVMRAAIVIAEQSVQVVTVRGERSSALCLVLNQMLSESIPPQSLLIILKSYLPSRPEPWLLCNLSKVQSELEIGSNYLQRLARALDYFDLVEIVSAPFYMSLYRSFGWLFFLVMREQVKPGNQCEHDYLLIAVLYIIARYGFDYLRPRTAPALDNNKDLISSILGQLFEIFEIDRPQVFKRVTNETDRCFEVLISSGVLSCSQGYDFLCPRLLPLNYRKVDSLYQRTRDPSRPDLRLLLAARYPTLTPNKQNLTPRQHKPKAGSSKAFASHRILTFEEGITHEPGIENKSSDRAVLPPNIKVSPSCGRAAKTTKRQSPNTEAFMRERVRRGIITSLSNEVQVFEIIRKVLGDPSPCKVKLVYQFFLATVGELCEEGSYQEEDFNGVHCSGLAISLLLVSIPSTAVQGSLSVLRDCLAQIRMEVAVTAYQLWLMNRFLLKSGLPLPQQRILLSLWELIATQLSLQAPSSEQMIQALRVEKGGEKTKTMEEFVDAVVDFGWNLMASCLSALGLEEKEQDLCSQLIMGLRKAVLNGVWALGQLSLHQVVLCCLYLSLRQHASTRFNQIIQAYQQANSISNPQLKALVGEVKIGQGQTDNIINFYNRIYLPFALNQTSNTTLTHPKTMQIMPRTAMTPGSSPTSNTGLANSPIGLKQDEHGKDGKVLTFGECAKLAKSRSPVEWEQSDDRDSTRRRGRGTGTTMQVGRGAEQ